MMLSPTYNYSTSLYETNPSGFGYPTLTMPYNCTVLSNNVTVITK